MKYYVDKNDQLFGFEEDGSQDHLIADDMKPISHEEVLERTKKEPVDPEYFTYKTDIWQRVTDQEAEILDAQLLEAPAKQRRMWDDSQRIEHQSDYYGTLREQMVAEFGESRADEILAPSN